MCKILLITMITAEDATKVADLCQNSDKSLDTKREAQAKQNQRKGLLNSAKLAAAAEVAREAGVGRDTGAGGAILGPLATK